MSDGHSPHIIAIRGGDIRRWVTESYGGHLPMRMIDKLLNLGTAIAVLRTGLKIR